MYKKEISEAEDAGQKRRVWQDLLAPTVKNVYRCFVTALHNYGKGL